MGMRDQIDDLKYLCSKDNTTSRGFYLMLVIAAVIMLIAGIALEVAAVLGIVSGGFRIFGFAFLPVIIIGLLVIVKWLSR